jgi:hypothetical protein
MRHNKRKERFFVQIAGAPRCDTPGATVMLATRANVVPVPTSVGAPVGTTIY